MENSDIIKKIFIFSFSGFDEPGEPEVEKRGFIINFKSMEEYEQFENWTIREVEIDGHDYWLDFIGDMEEYGVHDFGTNGYKEVVGFNSYEIRMKYRNEVMEKWRNFIIKNGYDCGTILTGLSDEDNDYPELDLSNALTPESQASWDRLKAAYDLKQNKV